MIYLFAVARIFAGASSNIFQKRLTNQGVEPLFVPVVMFVCLWCSLLVFLGHSSLLVVQFGFLQKAFFAAAFDATAYIFYMYALRESDLSIFGPLNAYKPAIAMLIAIPMLGEMPTLIGALGVLVIVCGSYVLNFSSSRKEKGNILRSFFSKGSMYRIASIILFAFAAVYQKEAIRISGPYTLLFYWSLFSAVLLLGYFLILRKHSIAQSIKTLVQYPRDYFLTTVLFSASAVFTFLTLQGFFVGYALALFQLSAVLNVFFGHAFFKEKDIFYRLLGSIIMILGALLIIL